MPFHSDRFIFRPTAMSLALNRAGIEKSPTFVREKKSEVVNSKMIVRAGQ